MGPQPHAGAAPGPGGVGPGPHSSTSGAGNSPVAGQGAKQGSAMRPAVPLAPASAGENSEQKQRRPVKAVTTAVEADANTQAIFGNRRPALPGVIGEWAKH